MVRGASQATLEVYEAIIEVHGGYIVSSLGLLEPPRASHCYGFGVRCYGTCVCGIAKASLYQAWTTTKGFSASLRRCKYDGDHWQKLWPRVNHTDDTTSVRVYS